MPIKTKISAHLKRMYFSSAHLELWYVLCLNLRGKIGQKRLFSCFWDEEVFRKIFRNSIFRYLKDTSAKPKSISKSVVFLLQRGMYTDKRKCTWRIGLNLRKTREKNAVCLKNRSTYSTRTFMLKSY